MDAAFGKFSWVLESSGSRGVRRRRLARMFWISGGEMPDEGPNEGAESAGEYRAPIELERDAPRPASILRVASELEERGGEIQELFKEIGAPWGQVVLPIHLLEGGRSHFIEVETEPWDPRAVEE